MEDEYQVDCVLLIDDDFITNYLNEQLLSDIKFCKNIETADSVEKALRFLEDCYQPKETQKSLLIFLDLNMPDLDGFDFLDALNSLTELPLHKIDIIILSSSLHRVDTERAEKYHILDYIVKPLSQEKLKAALGKKKINR